LCNTVLYITVLYVTKQDCAILYCILLYCMLLTTQDCAILYCMSLHRIVQYHGVMCTELLWYCSLYFILYSNFKFKLILYCTQNSSVHYYRIFNTVIQCTVLLCTVIQCTVLSVQNYSVQWYSVQYRSIQLYSTKYCFVPLSVLSTYCSVHGYSVLYCTTSDSVLYCFFTVILCSILLFIREYDQYLLCLQGYIVQYCSV